MPLPPDAYLVTIDTYRTDPGPRIAGRCDLEFDRYYFAKGKIGGNEGTFLLDLGAASSVMAKPYLPAGAAIRKGEMLQYSGAVAEIKKLTVGGATGNVEPLGVTGPTAISIGSIRVPEAVFTVLESLPDFRGRKIAGIVGLDILARSGHLSITGKGKHRKLTAGPSARKARSAGEPIARIKGHLMGRCWVNGKPVAMFLDTGSPFTIVDASDASVLPLKRSASTQRVGGLDGDQVGVEEAKGARLRFAGKERPVTTLIAPLAIFGTLRNKGRAIGILGNDFLSEYETLAVDFEKGRMHIR